MKCNFTGDELLLFLDALSNPHRLRIVNQLYTGKQYVSELARQLGMSRALLYLHLQKLEEANIVAGHMEILESGKAAKYYTLQPFDVQLNAALIAERINTLTTKKNIKLED